MGNDVGVQRFDARYPASPYSVGAMRGEAVAIARECGLEDRDLNDIALAVSEAATNAVVHGSPGDGPYVSISIEIERGEILIVVSDEGEGVKPRADSPGAGLGLPVIAAVTKRFEVVEGNQGTEVHMTFPCPNAVAA